MCVTNICKRIVKSGLIYSTCLFSHQEKIRALTLLLFMPVLAYGQLAHSASRPIANAGTDKSVLEGGRVTLDGSGSSDPNPGQFISTTADGNLPGGTSIQSSFTKLSEDGSLVGSVSIGNGPTISDTAVVYVIDVSGSAAYGGGCGGDQNNDSQSNSILDCEIAAALALHEQIIESGTVAEVGLVSFSYLDHVYDLDPTSERRFLIEPEADIDNNGVSDFEQIIRTLRAAGGT